MKKTVERSIKTPGPLLMQQGYDPEMLFVECARCGSPVVWEQGQSTRILEGAGIDPLELDSYCLLVTDGCPRCSRGSQYRVQVFRVEPPCEIWGSCGRFGNA